jgi:D-glycero-alpha-D-manno-heptose-7-phosphate kinase
MIIVRSPLRISLGGGGTDLPSYYSNHGGFVLAAAIDRYVYITVHRRFVKQILLKYSRLEEVDCVADIKHPIFREALKLFEGSAERLEIASMADIPAGTGLGSSGSFTTALLKALHSLRNDTIHPRELAEQACHIEIDILGEPIGKQDQYIAAYGGVTSFRLFPNGHVEVTPLRLGRDTLYALEDDLLLFFTGYSRAASDILREQDNRSKQNDREMNTNLHFIKDLAYESRGALETGDLRRFAELMNVHWEHKRKRSAAVSNDQINNWYELARKNGALGGKLIGAGGGGFLMFYAEDRASLRRAMREAGLEEVRFRFDFEGTKLLIQS